MGDMDFGLTPSAEETDLAYYARQGWLPEKDSYGKVKGFFRRVFFDPSRGKEQEGTRDPFGVEYVSADKFNDGSPKEGDVEYRTGGTNLVQHDNVPTWAKVGAMAPLALGAAYMAIPQFAGAVNALNAGSLAAGGGLLGGAGSAASGLSQAELAALIESGTQGAAGLGLEAAGLNGAGLTAAQYAALQNGGSLVAQGGIDAVVNSALTGAQSPVGIDPTGSNVLRYPGSTTTTTPKAPTTPGKGSIAKTIGNAIGVDPSLVTGLGGLLGAVGGYVDAKNNEGKRYGESPDAKAFLTKSQDDLKNKAYTKPDKSAMLGMLGNWQAPSSANFNQTRGMNMGLLGGGIPRTGMTSPDMNPIFDMILRRMQGG